MASRIVIPLVFVCSLLAACGGASDDPIAPPDAGEAGAPACAWAVCSDCGSTSHWVWTCDGTPTEPAPVGAAK